MAVSYCFNMFLKLIGMANLLNHDDEQRQHDHLITGSDLQESYRSVESNSESNEIERSKKQLQAAHHANQRLASQLHNQKIFYQNEILNLNHKIQRMKAEHQIELNIISSEMKPFRGGLILKDK